MAGKSTMLRMTCTAVIMAQREFQVTSIDSLRSASDCFFRLYSRMLRSSCESPYRSCRCNLLSNGSKRFHFRQRFDLQSRDGRLQQDSYQSELLCSPSSSSSINHSPTIECAAPSRQLLALSSFSTNSVEELRLTTVWQSLIQYFIA